MANSYSEESLDLSLLFDSMKDKEKKKNNDIPKYQLRIKTKKRSNLLLNRIDIDLSTQSKDITFLSKIKSLHQPMLYFQSPQLHQLLISLSTFSQFLQISERDMKTLVPISYFFSKSLWCHLIRKTLRMLYMLSFNLLLRMILGSIKTYHQANQL